MNPTIVITGGSKGIGKAVATLFSANGYDVITCGRGREALQNLKDELETVNSDITVHFQVADLSDKDEVMKFSQFVLEHSTKIDVLVNNTGVFIPGQIHKEEDDVLEHTINTNVYSAYHLTRQLLPGMMEESYGDIFNICSTASITPYVNGGSYCISKYALLGMTKVLREEMKEMGIRVMGVLPGATLTSSWEGVELPAERFVKPEDVAEAIYGAHKLSRQTVVEEILIRPQLGDIV